jgi:hypothetical protein
VEIVGEVGEWEFYVQLRAREEECRRWGVTGSHRVGVHGGDVVVPAWRAEQQPHCRKATRKEKEKKTKEADIVK